jgi:hypothetical protein
MKHKDQVAIWAADMFTLLAKPINADGLTRDQIMNAVGIPTVGEFHETKGVLQDACATSDTTIVGDSVTALSGGWTYSLQTDPHSGEARGYQISKLKGLFGRQCRAYMVARALQKGIKGNTAVGRQVGRMVRAHYNAIQETADALDELGVKVTMP